MKRVTSGDSARIALTSLPIRRCGLSPSRSELQLVHLKMRSFPFQLGLKTLSFVTLLTMVRDLEEEKVCPKNEDVRNPVFSGKIKSLT